MIHANELRIGNYVTYLSKLTRITAIQLGENISYISTLKSGAITINQIQPIPLTPEILEKCGFVYDDEEYPRIKTNQFEFCIYGVNYEKCDLIKDGICISLEYGQLKYLHQLQNLYFALTGEELNIQTLISPETSPATP